VTSNSSSLLFSSLCLAACLYIPSIRFISWRLSSCRCLPNSRSTGLFCTLRHQHYRLPLSSNLIHGYALPPIHDHHLSFDFAVYTQPACVDANFFNLHPQHQPRTPAPLVSSTLKSRSFPRPQPTISGHSFS